LELRAENGSKPLGISGYFTGEKLERGETVQPDIFCLVNDTHPPPPNFSILCEMIWPIIGANLAEVKRQVIERGG